MRFNGAIRIVCGAAAAALRQVSRWLMLPALGMAWLADRCEPREWKPRIWDRTGGRTANESRD